MSHELSSDLSVCMFLRVCVCVLVNKYMFCVCVRVCVGGRMCECVWGACVCVCGCVGMS